MPNKKINQLDVKVAVSTDLMLVGDPTSGTSFKSTLATLPLVPTSRTITINGVSQDLSANRTYTIDALPSQTGNSGKYLTTNGTIASWGVIDLSAYVPYTGATGAVNLGAFGITAASFVKSGGTSSQFLKADGSVDSSSYVTSNIYTANGTLTGARTLTLGGFTLDFIGSTYTNRFTSAGRLLLGTTSESTFLLDVNGTARVSGAMTFSGGSYTVGESMIFKNAANGLVIAGGGTASDLIIANKSGLVVFEIPPNTQNGIFYGSLQLNGNITNGNFQWTSSTNILAITGDINVSKSSTSSASEISVKIASGGGTFKAYGSGFGVPSLAGNVAFGAISPSNLIIFTNAAAASGGTGSLTIRGGGYDTAADILFIDKNGSVFKNGYVYVGSSTINSSAITQIDSTTKGFLPPRMTTTQKNAISSPAQGLMLFDTTLVKLCVYSGTAWETITSI